jgi:hypothetical protein
MIDKDKAVEAQLAAHEVFERIGFRAEGRLLPLLTADQLRELFEQRDRFAEDAQWAARRAIDYSNELEAVKAELDQYKKTFKNFHRLLCERFGYVHDAQDWQLDQLSLIEHIADVSKMVQAEKTE